MTLGLDPKTQGRLLAGALLFSFLMAGILAGVALSMLVGRRDRPHFVGGPPGGLFHAAAPAFGPDHSGMPGLPAGPGAGFGFQVFGIGNAFVDRLDLNETQRARVDSILAGRKPRVEAIYQQMEPRLKAIMDSTHAEIRAVLTPEQRAEFDRYREQRRDFLIRHIPGPGEVLEFERREIRR